MVGGYNSDLGQNASCVHKLLLTIVWLKNIEWKPSQKTDPKQSYNAAPGWIIVNSLHKLATRLLAVQQSLNYTYIIASPEAYIIAKVQRLS